MSAGKESPDHHAAIRAKAAGCGREEAPQKHDSIGLAPNPEEQRRQQNSDDAIGQQFAQGSHGSALDGSSGTPRASQDAAVKGDESHTNAVTRLFGSLAVALSHLAHGGLGDANLGSDSSLRPPGVREVFDEARPVRNTRHGASS